MGELALENKLVSSNLRGSAAELRKENEGLRKLVVHYQAEAHRYRAEVDRYSARLISLETAYAALERKHRNMREKLTKAFELINFCI